MNTGNTINYQIAMMATKVLKHVVINQEISDSITLLDVCYLNKPGESPLLVTFIIYASPET